jgi:hypothetical protein
MHLFATGIPEQLLQAAQLVSSIRSWRVMGVAMTSGSGGEIFTGLDDKNIT